MGSGRTALNHRLGAKIAEALESNGAANTIFVVENRFEEFRKR